MIKVLVVASSIFISAVSAGSGFCDVDMSTPERSMIEGAVVSIDIYKSILIVKAPDGNYTFKVAHDARMVRDSYDAEYDMGLKNLKPGDHIQVEFYDNPSGEHIATVISTLSGTDY